MKNMKKFAALALAAVMTFSLAACGSGDGESSSNSASGSESGSQSAKGVKVIDVDLTQEEYAFGVDKNQPELLEQVNTFIAKIKEDGTLDEIFDKYFGSGEPEAVKSATLDTSKDQLVVATNAAFEPFEYTQGEDYYGIDITEEVYKPLVWCYIPHLFYSPFYVYQYATSFATSLELYKRVNNNVPGAFDKYIGLLKSGGSAFPIDQVKAAGVDLTTKEPFQAVVKRMDELVRKLEELLND